MVLFAVLRALSSHRDRLLSATESANKSNASKVDRTSATSAESADAPLGERLASIGQALRDANSGLMFNCRFCPAGISTIATQCMTCAGRLSAKNQTRCPARIQRIQMKKPARPKPGGSLSNSNSSAGTHSCVFKMAANRGQYES